MMEPITGISPDPNKVERIIWKLHGRICVRTDKLIALLMALQWPGAIIAAFLVSAKTWNGAQSSIHPHVLIAIYLGGLITVLPVVLAFLYPGKRFTRHAIAACQMLMSGLLIHVSGGRIETHFHVFGSLAFLAFYLDWQVLLTATLVTLIDHVAMVYYAPAAIFGTTIGVNERLIEHILWVVFCDCFLITSCLQSQKALRRIATREAMQDLLLHQAYHDALTGLANRLLIQQTLTEMLSGATPEHAFALMAIDLDQFKEVNDTLGHAIGDLVLIEVSRRILEETCDQDVLARMGGDEFVLVIRECSDAASAERVAGRIVHILSQPFACGGHTIHIGGSIGIRLSGGGSVSIPDLFHHADLALYKAKNNGRNGFCTFDEAMLAETLHQMSLEHRLRIAILDQTMSVYYQPIVTSGSFLLGFEALLRWNDVVHGNVSPAEFIPIAERTGLIVPLGNWVLQQACRQAATWHRSNRSIRISVNISSLQLAHKDFVSVVLATLKETALPPELLDLELTEGTLIQNHGETRNALDLLHKYGIRFSIDDFGTGYSSLSYLRDLPVHTLKIDRSFVTDIATSDEARLLVEGMIEMAHSLRLRVVAEGVEDSGQMDILRNADCDEIQGFLISKAIPALDAGHFLNDSSLEVANDASQPQRPVGKRITAVAS
jgi:diguanylate cyclase (GGDEF)-like protein